MTLKAFIQIVEYLARWATHGEPVAASVPTGRIAARASTPSAAGRRRKL